MFNQTTIKILFLFLPGIIATVILEFFNEKNKKFSIKDFFICSFTLGVVSYILYSIYEKDILTSLMNYNENLFPLKEKDIFYLSVIGLILGIILTYLRTHGKIYLLANKLKISYETGFKDVFTSIYKSDNKDMKKLREKYIQIKLIDGTADYYGFLKHYEKHDNYTEVLLYEVDIIFNKNLGSSSEYTQEAIYLNLLNGTFQIEFVH